MYVLRNSKKKSQTRIVSGLRLSLAKMWFKMALSLLCLFGDLDMGNQTDDDEQKRTNVVAVIVYQIHKIADDQHQCTQDNEDDS